MMLTWKLLGVFVLLFFDGCSAFKAQDFKTCSQSGFCRRGRALSERAKNVAKSWVSPYSVDSSSITISKHRAEFGATVKSSLYPEINFGLEVRIYEDGVVRVRLDEVGGLRKRYDEAASWALIAEPRHRNQVKWIEGKREMKAVYGDKNEIEVVIAYQPLRISLLRNGKEQIVLNGQGLLHMEHFRNKSEPLSEAASVEGEGSTTEQIPLAAENPRAWFEGDAEDAYWEETFLTWTDSKPKGTYQVFLLFFLTFIPRLGPESLSVDINFPNHPVVYGIPQRATRLALPSTKGESATFEDPYRLYNADVFEYLASSPVSLYGSIPLMHAHSTKTTVAVFHLVSSETWIDVSHASDQSTETHWISESGIMDTFLLPGPTPEDVFRQYAKLTGTAVMPAHWSLGYHQCRWNYVSSEDIRTVQRRFDDEDMPMDVLWLDIEYSDNHKYFMWNEKTFPDPVEMINDVAALGRKVC